MYKVPIKVGASTIEGKGVFSVEDVTKGTLVWIFADRHDQALNPSKYHDLPDAEKTSLEKGGYLSPWTNTWIFPPEGDPARYTNHSPYNNLSAVFDANVSPEPFFVANRDIKSGEELTNNYHEFDKITQETRPDWAS